MSKLYLYNFNNYFNRIVKRGKNLSDYGTPIYQLNLTNFNYNDGVNTYHDINYDSQDGDYVVITDDEANITSRWFVIENKRNRGGQHRITLKRDLITDYYDVIVSSPMVINRGMINNIKNPLLFNPEGFSFNQVKESETPLKDKCGIPWYVLYFNDPQAKQITIQGKDPIADVVISGLISSITGSKYYISTVKGKVKYITDEGISGPNNYRYYNMAIESDNPMSLLERTYYTRDRDYIWFDENANEVVHVIDNAFKNQYNSLKTLILNDEALSGGITDETYNTLKSYNNKLVRDSNNDYYTIQVVESFTTIDRYIDEDDTSSTFANSCKTIINNTGLDRTGDWGDEAFGYNIVQNNLTITATPYVNESTITINDLFLSNETPAKATTLDSDYRIIAIPADDLSLWISDPTEYQPLMTIKKELSKKFLEAIMLAYSKDELVDVQYLPYCPIQKWLVEGGLYLDTSDLEATRQYGGFQSSSTNPSYVLCMYIENANLSFNIEKAFHVYNYDDETMDPRAIDYKIENETTLYRLVSPNYNGNFEFSIAKNYEVDFFNVDMTLKPFTPYIHINPNFKGLYGSDFNDARGLICQGDFSIPIHSDQFVEYEYRNKNYENAFERQMQNMDFNFEQQRVQGLFGAIAGGVVGGIGGAVTGAKVGGAVGGVVGGAVGGAASTIGGLIDYSMLEERQAEQRNYAIANYKYQLGNIKALVNNISKVTPLSYNNKIFPFVEKYSATDEEVELFREHLKYNSMTINKIDFIVNYLIEDTLTFISGTLIRALGLNMPTHELNEINKELEKGVYI